MQLTVIVLSVFSLHVVLTCCQGKTIITDDKDNEDAMVKLLQLLTSVQFAQTPDVGSHGNQRTGSADVVDLKTPDVGIHFGQDAVSVDVTDEQTSDVGIHGDQEVVPVDFTDAVLKEIMAEITEDVDIDLSKGCTHGKCEFCKRAKWFKVCVEASIVGLGFEVTVSLNGKTIYHKEISVRNPPPICFNRIPGLSKLADVCLVVYDVDLVNKKACVKITFKVKIGPIKKKFSIKIACFKIPLASLQETDQASDNASGALTLNGSSDNASGALTLNGSSDNASGALTLNGSSDNASGALTLNGSSDNASGALTLNGSSDNAGRGSLSTDLLITRVERSLSTDLLITRVERSLSMDLLITRVERSLSTDLLITRVERSLSTDLLITRVERSLSTESIRLDLSINIDTHSQYSLLGLLLYFYFFTFKWAI
ncbi:uncharacterized protein LOC127840755 [Dreissena polymorpha]|uniref:uncharacterized protein LOC127840755 n=1 Tax=Dreissena polymorpha TaxID=45954 RepID=UPI002264DBA0|nr:uncharacterized protein LOC127840755 [Dreissena polymorpha]